MFNYGVNLKYILNNNSYVFLSSKYFNKKTSKLLLSNKNGYYLILHIRLSSLTYLSQILDLFCYELPKHLKTKGPILVYNFHNLISNDRFVLFLLRQNSQIRTKSVVELYPNMNWLEREVGELFGFMFDGKNDTRNLMLQYGDASAPFKKSFPAIGIKELYYNFTSDAISQTPFTTQI